MRCIHRLVQSLYKRNPNITVKFACTDRVIAAARHKQKMLCFTRVQIESSFVYTCLVTNVERSETRLCRQIPTYVFYTLDCLLVIALTDA